MEQLSSGVQGLANQLQGAGQTSQSSSSEAASSSSSNRELDRKDFMKILIEQMQNQNPLQPTETNQFIKQMTGMENLRVIDQLGTVVEEMKKSQTLSSAGNMIGKTIKGQTTGGGTVEGEVTRVSVEGDNVNLHVGNSKIPPSNVTDIIANNSSQNSS